MASLLDQYEQRVGVVQDSMSSSANLNLPRQIDANLAASLITSNLQIDDTPIFNKQRIDYTFRNDITHLAVSSNYVIVAMINNVLLRIDLTRPDQPDEIDLKTSGGRSPDERIHQLYLDPSGWHLLVSLKHNEVLYLARNQRKPKIISKMRTHIIESIGWNIYDSDDNHTGPIIIGTQSGSLYESQLVCSDESQVAPSLFQRGPEKYFEQIYSIDSGGDVDSVPITGCELVRLPTSSLTDKRYYIMATTPARLYQFIGNVPYTSSDPPVLQHIFNLYSNRPASFLELPGSCGYSVLKLYRHKGSQSTPRQFAWMTGPGIYVGELEFGGSSESVTTNSRLLRYRDESSSTGTSASTWGTPVSIALTQFHVLLLIQDTVKVMSTLNDKLVYEDHFSQRYGGVVGISQDPIKGTVWVYAQRAVFKYKIVREARDVWKMYLNKQQFDKAKEYAKNNPVDLDQVVTSEAEYYFSNKQYNESARCYARSQGTTFENIVLKFINHGQRPALRIYLIKKLEALRPAEKSQISMLVLWVIELYLTHLGQLAGGEGEGDVQEVEDDLHRFLNIARVKECSKENRQVIYKLMSSHGNLEHLVYFATLMGDYERVIQHHLQHEQPMQALQVLNSQSNIELYYKFSPVLMQYIPRDTVDAWISRGSSLQPKRLIPALVQYHQYKQNRQGNEALRYLEYVVDVLKNKEQAIHNYLLSLYARLQPDRLLHYLTTQGQDSSNVCYDVKYALRLCSEHSLHRACVYIYTTMGLYEEAVDLALKVDVDLAKLNANIPTTTSMATSEENDELRKKLWLRIARHVVEEQKDIQKAMEFVQESELVKIEDVLPFFPDFVTIDHFKEAICASLQEYNAHIESLKTDMDEATQSAQEIRGEIQSFRAKYSTVGSSDKCSHCGYPVLTRAFYLFPCHHMFHSDCLRAEVSPHLTSQRRQRLDELLTTASTTAGQARREWDNVSVSSINPLSTTTPTTHLNQYEMIKSEIDEMIGSECVYCGDMMVRSIDTPFIDPHEYDAVMAQWS